MPLLAGTLKLAVITVSISLVCGADNPVSLPEPDSAHYNRLKIFLRYGEIISTAGFNRETSIESGPADFVAFSF